MIKFRKHCRRVLTAVLSAAMLCTVMNPVRVEAENVQSEPDWTKKTSVWQVSEGVTAHVTDGVLYFDGNGAIPDYTNDTLYQRPWHTSYFGTVVVGNGITDIGTKAFAEFKYLRYFFIPSTTFVKNSSAFHNIDSDPVIRIQGTTETTRMIGNKVPYTSLDSWASIAQSLSYNTLYVMDNGTMKNTLRQKTYPNVPNVYSADNPDIDQPSELKAKEEEKLQPFTSPSRFAPGYEMTGYAVTAKIVKPGEQYLDVIAYYLNNIYPEYQYGQSYLNTVSVGEKLYDSFDGAKNYVLQIPSNLQSPGRTFKIIQVVNGQPAVLEDLDSSDSTITFSTDKGTFTYSIIYTN